MVISTFGYHHISDKYKPEYVKKVVSSLKPSFFFIIADVFTNDDTAFYNKAYDEFVQNNGPWPEMKTYIIEMTRSTNCEFKVPLSFAKEQFEAYGLSLIHEKKIWPFDKEIGESGAYTLVYKKTIVESKK